MIRFLKNLKQIKITKIQKDLYQELKMGNVEINIPEKIKLQWIFIAYVQVVMKIQYMKKL